MDKKLCFGTASSDVYVKLDDFYGLIPDQKWDYVPLIQQICPLVQRIYVSVEDTRRNNVLWMPEDSSAGRSSLDGFTAPHQFLLVWRRRIENVSQIDILWRNAALYFVKERRSNVVQFQSMKCSLPSDMCCLLDCVSASSRPISAKMRMLQTKIRSKIYQTPSILERTNLSDPTQSPACQFESIIPLNHDLGKVVSEWRREEKITVNEEMDLSFWWSPFFITLSQLAERRESM